MNRLTTSELHGIWAGITMSWDENYRFDEVSYRANTERLCQAGIHGVYTSGSTGEFYALDYQEFCLMVDIQDEICGKYNMPLQIGCCSDNTWSTIKLLEYASSKEHVGAVQFVIPYWMELTDREVLSFFADLHRAAPDMPLVHYNIPRSKRFLNGHDYLRLLGAAPNLIGVKYAFAGSNFDQLQSAIMMTPQLSYFVAETMLVSSMMLGAKGCYSSLVSTNPPLIMELYSLARSGRWEEAIEMQQMIARFGEDIRAFVRNRGEGTIDPVSDKGKALASGCIVGSPLTRAPYIGWTQETVEAVHKWLEMNYPQFIYGADLKWR